MSTQDRYIENPNGVVTDTVLKKEWLPKDSYGDLGRWMSWPEVQSYIGTMRNVYAGGFCDWRLPTKEEALGLYQEELELKDWEGEVVRLHKAFVAKCARIIWTSEVNEAGQALVVNFQDGTAEFIDKDTKDNNSARLVRDPNPPSPTEA